jgi:hypothetical protein
VIKLIDLIKEIYRDVGTWYHGSASGDLRGGTSGLHLGTYKAAYDALTATIGYPVEGDWDGTREYGKTLLCGSKSLKERRISITGFNCDVPVEDFFVGNTNLKPTYSNREPIPLTVTPAIKKYKITCPMTNTPNTAYDDFKANGYMKAALKRGNVRCGWYYKNISEDAGSISVVVANGSCVKEV